MSSRRSFDVGYTKLDGRFLLETGVSVTSVENFTKSKAFRKVPGGNVRVFKMNDELREFNKYTSTPVTEFSESDLTASLDVSSTLPAAYSNLNIVEHMKELHFQHTLPLQESDLYDVRFAAEMSWFQTKDKFDILKTVKFIVDRLKMASVPWGVGRGSSVYSYLLFLLELHAIDPIVHELDYREFLRV